MISIWRGSFFFNLNILYVIPVVGLRRSPLFIENCYAIKMRPGRGRTTFCMNFFYLDLLGESNQHILFLFGELDFLKPGQNLTFVF